MLRCRHSRPGRPFARRTPMSLDRNLVRALLAAAAATALAVPPATAAALGSPPVTAGGGALVECSIANLTGSSAKVTIRVFDNDAELTHAGPAPLGGHKSASAT